MDQDATSGAAVASRLRLACEVVIQREALSPQEVAASAVRGAYGPLPGIKGGTFPLLANGAPVALGVPVKRRGRWFLRITEVHP